MNWSRWFGLAIQWGGDSGAGRDIRLTARFSKNEDEIPGCCRFWAGLAGGELSLEAHSGWIPLKPRWPKDGRPAHDPTKDWDIEPNDSETHPQWRIKGPPDRLAHRPSHLDGSFDYASFARFIGQGQPHSVTATYRVAELRHLKILRIDWTPRFPNANAALLSAKKQVVSEALIRRLVYDALGSVAGTATISQP